MDSKDIISIVVPVYNAAAHLPRCIESIISQDYRNLEIWLCDDASQDDSLKICWEYAKKDPRIHVLPLPKGGVSAARNAGLKRASGKWLMFADSDDAMAPGACSHMVSVIQENDMALAHFNFCFGVSVSDRGVLHSEERLSQTDFLEKLIKKPGTFYYSALWNKMYRMDIVRELNLTFDTYFNWGEDFAFNMRYYEAAESICLTNTPIYNYYKNSTGTSIRSLKRPIHSCAIKYQLYKRLKKLYQSKGLDRKYRFKLFAYIGNVTLSD